MKKIHLISINKQIITAAMLFVAVLIICSAGLNGSTSTFSNSDSIESQNKLCEEFSLYLLYPYIQDALIDYYGTPKQFWQDKILGIRKVEIDYRNFFEITVQVETFEGAHNPPRGRDTITFRTKEYTTSLKMIKFKHEDI